MSTKSGNSGKKRCCIKNIKEKSDAANAAKKQILQLMKMLVSLFMTKLNFDFYSNMLRFAL